jgi:hypothetical protein
MAVDTTGRLKISQPLTLFEYHSNKLDFSNLNTWIDTDYTVSTGITPRPSIQNNTTTNTIDLTLNSTSTDNTQVITRETKQLMIFQPGVARTTLFGFCPYVCDVSDPVETASGYIYSRVGIFNTDDDPAQSTDYYKKDPIDGFYFEVYIDDSGTKTAKWCYAYDSTITSISQSSWNIDVFDGDGPSGKTINNSSLERTMLCIIEQEWGVGRVKVGFRIDGITYWAHQFTQTSTTAFQVNYPYTKTSLVPIMYQIGCSGTTLSNDVILRKIFCSCISEGNSVIKGIPFSYSTAYSNIEGVLINDTNKRVILGLGLNTVSYENMFGKLISMNACYRSVSGFHNDNNIVIEIYGHISYKKGSSETSYTLGAINNGSTFDIINDSIFTGYVGNGSEYVSTDGYKLGTFFITKQGNNEFIFDERNLSKDIISKYDRIFFTARTTNALTNEISLSLTVNLQQFI